MNGTTPYLGNSSYPPGFILTHPVGAWHALVQIAKFFFVFLSTVAEGDPGANFNSKSLSLRVQKKVASKMSTKGVAKTLVDDTTAELLDNLHKVAKLEYGNKKDAEKLVKYVVKMVVKVGILIRNDQFNAQELKLLEQFQQKFHNVIMTAISFHEVDFTYDRDFFSAQVQGLEDILQKVVDRHLREKSQKRITLIFGFFKNGDFLDKLFVSGGSYKGEMTIITKLLNKLVEEGNI